MPLKKFVVMVVLIAIFLTIFPLSCASESEWIVNIENTSINANETGHLIGITGSWEEEIFALFIRINYGPTLGIGDINITNISFEGCIQEPINSATNINNGDTTGSILAYVLFGGPPYTEGNGIPAGSGKLFNIVVDIAETAEAQEIDFVLSDSLSPWYAILQGAHAEPTVTPGVLAITAPPPELQINVQEYIMEGDDLDIYVLSDGDYIKDADVLFNNIVKKTNENGQVTFKVPNVDKNTNFQISASKDSYISDSDSVTVLNKNEKKPSGHIFGYVFTTSNEPVERADVCAKISEDSSICMLTDEFGRYTINIPIGSYIVEASKQSFEKSIEENIIVEENSAIQVDFILTLPADQEIETDKDAIDFLIDGKIKNGEIGGKLVFEDDENLVQIYNNALEINISEYIKSERITFRVSAEENTSSQVIVIKIDSKSLKDLSNINITYDGAEIEKAGFEDVISGGSSEEAIWSSILTSFEKEEKLYVLIKIPKFSEHVISIESVSKIIEEISDIETLMVYLSVLILVGVIIVAPIIAIDKKRRK